MSRTTRKHSRIGCPVGKCSWCESNRTHAAQKAASAAMADLQAYVLSVIEAEPEPTGGVDEYGECWGTRIGQDPTCRCFTCDDVWSAISGHCVFCGQKGCTL